MATIAFRVLPQGDSVTSKDGWAAFLNRDRWDDWSKYCTQFYLSVVDPEGRLHNIGHVKIGQLGLKPHAPSSSLPKGHRKPSLFETFSKLDDAFFSVGQDEDYYTNLLSLSDQVGEHILDALNDVAASKGHWMRSKSESVMQESLLRSVTATTVEGRFRRIAHGDAQSTKYDFSYSLPKFLRGGGPPLRLQFGVDPKSSIPTNVHVLIGRNGVGKTTLLTLMTKALVEQDSTARTAGSFKLIEETKSGKFANVATVSFSAFDDIDLLPDREAKEGTLGFSHISLRAWTSDSPTASIRTKTPDALAKEFVKCLTECRIGARRKRWTRAMEILESDPIFKASNLVGLIDPGSETSSGHSRALSIFKKLSSGHKIVLLTLTRLVQVVEERTLVLLDEPEAHLHPPLLSAMIRAISELMVKRNAVAIIATHSPIVLQEVPATCVWLLDRFDGVPTAARPAIETFGEAIGILTREVFSLELVKSGYHQLLREVRDSSITYEDAIRSIGGQLGAEGRAVLRGMFLNPEN